MSCPIWEFILPLQENDFDDIVRSVDIDNEYFSLNELCGDEVHIFEIVVVYFFLFSELNLHKQFARSTKLNLTRQINLDDDDWEIVAMILDELEYEGSRILWT